ncbi:MAG: hypothetical protein SH848_17360 [Saprospiraceae bacterium]|nr:hypothetical protein [Saprospiraceae bacterium]MDZ4705699.1 hypothetical protein [Saprospiraceae bacterium]
MKKNELSSLLRLTAIVLLIAVGGWYTATLLPWWRVLVLGLLGGLFFADGLKKWVFAAGFLGGMLLWGLHASYLSGLNGGILGERIGGLFGGIGATGAIVLTAVLGGLYGGLGAWTGKLVRGVFG